MNIKETLTLLSRWADRVELTTGHRGWTLSCIVAGELQSYTNQDLDELFSLFIDHAILNQKWPRGFYLDI